MELNWDVKPKNGLDAFFTQASFDRFNNTKTLQDTILYRIEELKRLGGTENKPVVTKVAPKSDLLFIKSEDKNEDTVHQDLGETSNQQNERKKQSKGAKKKEKLAALQAKHKTFGPSMPVSPPKKSALTWHEQRLYLMLNEKYKGNYPKDPTEEEIIEEKLSYSQKRVENYPKYYDHFDHIEILPDENLQQAPVLNYNRTLLELGEVPKMMLPFTLSGQKPAIKQDYSSVNRNFPASGANTENSFTWNHQPCSQDKNAELLACKHECQVVLSAGALKCLISHQSGETSKPWELPFSIKEYYKQDGDERSTLKVVYLDKPFKTTNFTMRDKNELYHKYALRSQLIQKGTKGVVFGRPKHNARASDYTEKMKMFKKVLTVSEKAVQGLPEDIFSSSVAKRGKKQDETSAAQKGKKVGKAAANKNVFDTGYDVNLEDLESFGTGTKVGKASLHIFQTSEEKVAKLESSVKSPDRVSQTLIDLKLNKKKWEIENSIVEIHDAADTNDMHDIEKSLIEQDGLACSGSNERRSSSLLMEKDQNRENYSIKSLDTNDMYDIEESLNEQDGLACSGSNERRSSSLLMEKDQNRENYSIKSLDTNDMHDIEESLDEHDGLACSGSNERRSSSLLMEKDQNRENYYIKMDSINEGHNDSDDSDNDKLVICFENQEEQSKSSRSSQLTRRPLNSEVTEGGLNILKWDNPPCIDRISSLDNFTYLDTPSSPCNTSSPANPSSPENHASPNETHPRSPNLPLSPPFPLQPFEMSCKMIPLQRLTDIDTEDEKDNESILVLQSDNSDLDLPVNREHGTFSQRKAEPNISRKRKKSEMIDSDLNITKKTSVALRRSPRCKSRVSIESLLTGNSVTECSEITQMTNDSLSCDNLPDHLTSIPLKKDNRDSSLADDNSSNNLAASTKRRRQSRRLADIGKLENVDSQEIEFSVVAKSDSLTQLHDKKSDVSIVELATKSAHNQHPVGETPARRLTRSSQKSVSVCAESPSLWTNNQPLVTPPNAVIPRKRGRPRKVLQTSSNITEQSCVNGDEKASMSQKTQGDEMEMYDGKDKSEGEVTQKDSNSSLLDAVALKSPNKKIDEKKKDTAVTHLKLPRMPEANKGAKSQQNVTKQTGCGVSPLDAIMNLQQKMLKNPSDVALAQVNEQEDLTVYLHPNSHNVTYHLWSFSGMQLLIRCNYHGVIRRSQQQMNYVYVSPKIEYQTTFGFEQMTTTEIANNWISVYIRPNCRLLQARINPTTSDILLLQEAELSQLIPQYSSFRPGESFLFVQTVLKKLQQLPPGDFLLSHKAGENTCEILKSTVNNKRGAYNLHFSYLGFMNISSVDDPVPWIPIDPNMVTVQHNKNGRIPATFEPNDFIKPNKSQKTKKNKKKKK
ncbi:hypothetical protein ScPMuIL_015124 [Solemya velum]